MVKISKEAKVGFIGVVALFILGWGINFLKGNDVFVPGYMLYGTYSRIDGLTKASPVYFKGFQIGSVRDIQLSGEIDKIIVTMSIEEDVEFPKNTVAQIYSLDLMGSKGIRFIYGGSNELLFAGDTMQTSIMGDFADQVSQEVLPLKDKAEKLVVKLDSVLTNMNEVFDDENKASLALGMRQFALSMRNFNKMSALMSENMQHEGAIGQTFSNLDSFSQLLNENGKLLSESMKNMEVITRQLAQAHVDSVVYQMNLTLTSVNEALSSINEEEGSLGLLLKDEKLYNNLNEASISLDRLLNDVRHHPKRYVNFSAISFGGGKTSDDISEEIVYKVLLTKSKEPLKLRDEKIKDKYQVFEDRDGKYFIYTVGNEDNYKSISVLFSEINELYPKAEIIVLKGGKQVSLGSVK